MPATGRSISTFARSGSNQSEDSHLGRGKVGPAQSYPARPAEHQFQGLFRGLGTSCREPVSCRRNTSLKRLHDATHFAVGCELWDEGSLNASMAKASYGDPGIVYHGTEPPTIAASSVELRQTEHQPSFHYRTEHRECFAAPGDQARDAPFGTHDTPHLLAHEGSGRELQSQCHAVHGRIGDLEVQRAGSLRAAGNGVLVPTSAWPKPARCDPLNGGNRRLDNHDIGAARGHAARCGRVTANRSNIVSEANVRNPVLGHHMPVAALDRPALIATADIIAEANKDVPPLRSLAAVRPHC
mmetsp:Transcript_103366/g.205462  ORF Transcript_103366/g.205462 Transcript_103366/m.205462 type:complete len:298 (+) Transcript_103366:48-941(+)